MLRFGERKVKNEKFYAANKPWIIWDVNIDNRIISKLVITKTNFKYLIGYLDKVIRPLVLIMPETNGCVKIFKVKDKNSNVFPYRWREIIKKSYKATCTRKKYLKNIELNAIPVCDDRYIKTKIITYDDKVYTNFRGWNVPEDDIECKSVTFISIDSLLVYENKYLLKVYLDSCAYKIKDKRMKDYLDDNLFEN